MFLTDGEIEVLKDEMLDTVKSGADLVQFTIRKIMENPLAAAGVLAVFALVLFGRSIKLSDILEIKK